MHTQPSLPAEEIPVPHASADGTVYLNDASLYMPEADPMGMYADGSMICDDYSQCAPMYCPPVVTQVPLAPPVRLESWRLYGTYLLLHAVGGDVAYAQQQDGPGGAGTTPFGTVGTTDVGYGSGVRVGGLLALDSATGLGVSYTFFESGGGSSIDAPNIANGTLGSLIHHPEVAITSSADPVSASQQIDFQTAEIDVRRLVTAQGNRWVYFTLGARYGYLEQNFSTRGLYAGAPGGSILSGTDIDFKGLGLRVGTETEQKLGNSRWSVYGTAAASSLFGQVDADYIMYNASTVTDLAIVRWRDDRVVPMLEYEVGLAWTNDNGCLRLSVGYTVTHWFNTVTTPEFIDAVQADNYTDLGDTLTFGGLASKVEWRY